MFRGTAYRSKWNMWIRSLWVRGLAGVVLVLAFFGLLGYALERGSSQQWIRLLAEQRFPFESLLLEGVPGFSEPKRQQVDQFRRQGLSIGMFLLTGVNLTDSRTYFFAYFVPPPKGPAWIGWAYNPEDPEYEGDISEGPLNIPPKPEGESPQPVEDPDSTGILSLDTLVGIYHTHNGESYAGLGDRERVSEGNGDVVTVGEVLKNTLLKKGIGAVQAREIHDGEDYMKAYSKSLLTAGYLLKKYPSLKLLIDLHRDGLPPAVGKSTVLIGNKEACRVMVVIGKKNPHWLANQKAAVELIAFGEKKYPGLFLPKITYANDARYNQHLSEGALLLEIGSQLNTPDEALVAAEALAQVIADYLKEKMAQDIPKSKDR